MLGPQVIPKMHGCKQQRKPGHSVRVFFIIVYALVHPTHCLFPTPLDFRSCSVHSIKIGGIATVPEKHLLDLIA
jgi:hypothetical protein